MSFKKQVWKSTWPKPLSFWRLNGYQAKSIRKQFLVKRDSETWLRVPRTNASDTLIPVKQAHQYLGVIASFYAFEDQTLSHRLRIGRVTFLRLRPWFIRLSALSWRLRRTTTTKEEEGQTRRQGKTRHRKCLKSRGP